MDKGSARYSNRDKREGKFIAVRTRQVDRCVKSDQLASRKMGRQVTLTKEEGQPGS